MGKSVTLEHWKAQLGQSLSLSLGGGNLFDFVVADPDSLLSFCSFLKKTISLLLCLSISWRVNLCQIMPTIDRALE